MQQRLEEITRKVGVAVSTLESIHPGHYLIKLLHPHQIVVGSKRRKIVFDEGYVIPNYGDKAIEFATAFGCLSAVPIEQIWQNYLVALQKTIEIKTTGVRRDEERWYDKL